MADLEIDGGELVRHLSGAEKVEGIHGDLRVPLSAATGVEVGMVLAAGKKLFAAVRRDTPRGVRVSLSGAGQDEWVVGCADPEALAASFSTARGPR